MSIIRRLTAHREDEQRSSLGFGYWPRDLPFTTPTSSGQVVTIESAARSAAVSACQRVLTTSVSSLPVDVVRKVGSRRQIVSPTPQVVRSPSGRVRRRVWVAQVMRALVGPGNAYGQVVAIDSGGMATQVEILAPRDVAWRKGADGVDKPFVNGAEHDLWPLGDIVHIPASAFIQPGSIVADSPVELAKNAIGVGLAAEDFGARFFGDGYHPTAVAKSDRDLTPEQAADIKAAINRMRHNREPGVFGSGLAIEFPEINPEDSQFIDLMRFEVEQACRFWGVPPSMAYAAVSGQNVTYANVSEGDLQFLKHSLRSWLHDVEDAWSDLLRAPQQVKFNVNALLEVDAPKRHQLYERRLRARTITVNEIRALEDEEPFDDPTFDEPGTPGGIAAPAPSGPAQED